MEITHFIEQFKRSFTYEILSSALDDSIIFERAPCANNGVLWINKLVREAWLSFKGCPVKNGNSIGWINKQDLIFYAEFHRASTSHIQASTYSRIKTQAEGNAPASWAVVNWKTSG